VPDPPPPRFPPLPPPPTDQTSFLPNSQLNGPIITCPSPSESVSTPDDSSRQGDSRATAQPPKRQPSQRASGRSSKKRKVGKADGDDVIVRAFLIFVTHPDAEISRAQSLCFNAA
jgi:hypothetical protein